ncbi:MAG: peptidase S9 [Bacteroidota bacterium]
MFRSRFRLLLPTIPAALACLLILSILVPVMPASAQYFGRNKVQYDDFDFQVFETEHFQFYYYPESEQAVKDAARMAERWYRRHARTYLREFREKKPIIFYANDADFQQTNVISGQIGEGVGGVTEGLKQRVVMPLTGVYGQTDHVLGHELVHSFQFDLAFSPDDSSRFALGLMPLWLIEGTAEYLSLGREDSHTTMWMRDAALRDDLPSIKQMTEDMRSYFPYRYGQSYMAYIGGKYGDAAVANIYKLGGRVSVDSAIVYTLGITPDSLSNEWREAIKTAYLPLVEGRTPADSAGKRVLAEDLDGGSMNLAPSISPDGQYVAFISERDEFFINLHIADAQTGKVIQRLRRTGADPYFDALRFINSSGSWSPDGQSFAFITFVQGDNEITVVDANSGSITRRITVEGVGALSNPAWSPDGTSMLFTGIDGGISDLYLMDMATSQVRKLTDDRYADLQPTWSPDGRTIAFATDRGPDGTNFRTLEFGKMRIATLDIESGEVKIIRPFPRAQHTNPQFAPDGRSLYFISDQDGFKDIYRTNLATDATYRVTKLQTGVSGITSSSPAMSVAAQNGRLMFSVFSNNSYNVFSLEAEEAAGTLVTEPEDAYRVAARILPPQRAIDEGLVGDYLSDPLTGLPEAEDYDSQPYSSRLQLDFVAPPSVGAQVGGFNSGLAGGVGFFFSDMLGNRNLGIAAQINGTIRDFGAQVSYLNRERRLNYGFSASHVPLLFGGFQSGFVIDPETGATSFVQDRVLRRIYLQQASLDGSYPLTSTRRFEMSGGFLRYGFDYEIERFFFNGVGGARRERIQQDELEPDAEYFFLSSLAYVVDFSFTGFTSPIRGGRYRFQVTPRVGSNTFVTALADYRRYFQIAQPLTFAIRGLHVGNYGNRDGDVFTTEFLGYSFRPGFIRGYSFGSFESSECTFAPDGSCPQQDRLLGTRIAMASAELRVPLFGTQDFGLIPFPYLPTELSLFADAGVAWTQDEAPVLAFDRDSVDRVPLVSVGASSRFNLFGYMVLELFYAYPFQRPDKGGHFGVQLLPGW